MDSVESQIFQPHAARHMLKSSIKLWGGGASHMVRIKLEVSQSFVGLPVL